MRSCREAGLTTHMLTFPAGETNKTLATASRLFDGLFALTPAVDRRTLVIALGGGVTGDLAGFVAATALRGLAFVQCPTTVLADVDASVGGKTGVDHAAGKNLIGAFHQPAGVLADVRCLATCSDDVYRDGLAECVKHGIIRSAELLEFIEDHAGGILRRDDGVMTDFLTSNVRIKADVVAEDERESGVREHLNFGHTVEFGFKTAFF